MMMIIDDDDHTVTDKKIAPPYVFMISLAIQRDRVGTRAQKIANFLLN
jgi:hypothetical protein